MRKTLPILLALALGRVSVAEAPAADAAAALAPADTFLLMRLPSLERMDALGNEFKSVWLSLVPKGERDALKDTPISTLLLGEMGVPAGAPVVRNRPLYLAFGELHDDPIFFLPAEAGKEFAECDARHRAVARLREGFLCVGRKDHLDAPARGKPATLLAGDVSAHFFISELVARHKEELNKAFAGAQAELPPLPAMFQPLAAALIGVARDATFGVDTAGYALTWTGERLESEGLITSLEGSRVAAFLSRVAPAEANDLAAFLPKNALFVGDSSGTANWFSTEIGKLVGSTLGEGAGEVIGQLLGGAVLPPDMLTGRTASSMSLEGMAASGVGLVELKDGAKAKEALKAFDPTKANETFKKLQIPVSIVFEPSVATHGETEIHRLRIQLDDPQMAMMAQFMPQSYFAIEGSMMVLSQSALGDAELKAMIDLVRAGTKAADHPHIAAMNRLGRKRHIGLTINVGIVKQFAFFLAMQSPEAFRAVSAIPDTMLMSTAIVMEGGALHWRGDWPLKEIGQIIQTVAAGEESADEGEETEEGPTTPGDDEEEVR